MQQKTPVGLSRKEAALYAKLDPHRLLHHIAIIMDGNGRWKRERRYGGLSDEPQRAKAKVR